MRTLTRLARRVLFRPHPAPVFLLGHPKSGTTAVASLLSRLTGLPVGLDMFRSIGRDRALLERLHRREVPFADFVREYPWHFSRPLVKCPKLTFLEPQVRERFPDSRFVLIVRDPRDTIRSFLHRRGVPGRGPGLLPLDPFPPLPGDPLEVLARRWCLAVAPWMAAPDAFTLLRYEDFAAGREGAIRRLAADLGLPAVHRLEGHLGRPYKPFSGTYDPAEFFGPENLRRLEEICAAERERLGYA